MRRATARKAPPLNVYSCLQYHLSLLFQPRSKALESLRFPHINLDLPTSSIKIIILNSSLHRTLCKSLQSSKFPVLINVCPDVSRTVYELKNLCLYKQSVSNDYAIQRHHISDACLSVTTCRLSHLPLFFLYHHFTQ